MRPQAFPRAAPWRRNRGVVSSTLQLDPQNITPAWSGVGVVVCALFLLHQAWSRSSIWRPHMATTRPASAQEAGGGRRAGLGWAQQVGAQAELGWAEAELLCPVTRMLWILPAKPSGAAATAGWEEEPPLSTSTVRRTYPSMTSQTSTFEPSLKYGELGAGSGMWGRCSSHSHTPLGAEDLRYRNHPVRRLQMLWVRL